MKKILTICLTSIALAIVIIGGFYLAIVWITRLDVKQVTPSLTQPIQFTEPLVDLSTYTIPDVVEIATLGHPEGNVGVVSMTQPKMKSEILLAVYEDGLFRRWNINSQEIIAAYDFSCANRRGVNFSADGSLVITPGEIFPEGVRGYTIWNTQTGEPLDCWGAHCQNSARNISQNIHKGIFLDSIGRWVIAYSGSVISAVGLKLDNSILMSLDNPDDDVEMHISQMNQDKSGVYMAYFLEEGPGKIVRTEDLFGGKRVFIEKSINLGKFSSVEKNQVVDLSFDDTLTWLTLLNEKELMIWNLSKPKNSYQFRMLVSDGTRIAFNHKGTVLAVGTKKGLFILDLKSKEKIINLNVGEVSALYFTQDDRSLMWGDDKGQIHILGSRRNDS